MIEENRPGTIVTFETRGEANEEVDKVTRYKQIIEILKGGNKLTAKEIAVEMCKRGFIPTTERNYAAPRLTELSQTGVVEPIGKKRCVYTGKSVAVYKLREGQFNLFDYL